MRKLFHLLPLLAFFVLATWFAMALRPNYNPQILPSAMINQPAPPFDLATLNGNAALSLNGLKGQVVLVNFFASWCLPCREEHPILMRLAEQEHVPLYGIDYKDRPEDARRILAQLGDPYRAIGLDPDGTAGLNFGVYGVPETYVIDKTGTIRKRFVGPLTAEALQRELLPLLKQLNAS
jgi:cytochrome c biogenesis protein CcmG, thiol:disulfide interchange protein DsbE